MLDAEPADVSSRDLSLAFDMATDGPVEADADPTPDAGIPPLFDCPVLVPWPRSFTTWIATDVELLGLDAGDDDAPRRAPIRFDARVRRIKLLHDAVHAVATTGEHLLRLDLREQIDIRERVRDPDHVAISTDGRYGYLGTAGENPVLAVYDLESGTVVDQEPNQPGVQSHPLDPNYTGLTVSADQRIYVGARGSVQVFELRAGLGRQRRRGLAAHRGARVATQRRQPLARRCPLAARGWL